MVNSDEVRKWFKEMGYIKALPENMASLVNASTYRLWNDIMEKVRPKQEAEKVTSNIILNRLKTKPLNQQDEFTSKIDEIENIRKRQELQAKLKQMQEKVDVQYQYLEKIKGKCKIKEYTLHQLKQQIKEKEQKFYLLNAKKTLLNSQISQAQKDLQSIEASSSPSNISLSRHLTKESLETFTKEIELISTELKPQNTSMKSVASSMKKLTHMRSYNPTPDDCSLYYKTLSAKHSTQITNCSQTNYQNPPNASKNIETIKMKRKLFEYPELKRKDMNDSSTISSIDVLSNLDLSNMVELNLTVKEKPATINAQYLDSNISGDSSKSQHIIARQRGEFKKTLQRNSRIQTMLQNMLNENHGNLLYLTLNKVIKDGIQELVMYVNREGNFHKISEMGSCAHNDKTKLLFIHVQNEIRIINQQETMDKLISRICKQKMKAMEMLKTLMSAERLHSWMEINIRKQSLQATSDALAKEIENSKIDDDQVIPREIVAMKLTTVKNDLKIKKINLKYLLDKSSEQLYIVKQVNEEFMGLLTKINLIKLNIDWYQPLLENLWSKEMELFENFPLEYQRRCTLTNPRMYYRDLYVNLYHHCEKRNIEDLQMLFDFLGGPLNPMETVLANILKMKKKVDVLKMLNNTNQMPLNYVQKYSFRDLEKQENYINHAIERCLSIGWSSNRLKTESIEDTIRETIYIWLNMPMKNIISFKRTYQGKPLVYYQNKLDSLE